METSKFDKDAKIILNEKESNLIKLLREVAFGKVTVFLENGLPIRIEEIRKSIKL